MLEKETEGLLISYDFSKKIANFFFSHKELIKICKNAKNFHIDAIYNFVDLRFPVIIIWVSDNTEKFHLLGIGIITNESCDLYSWCMMKLKDFYFEPCYIINVENIIADAHFR